MTISSENTAAVEHIEPMNPNFIVASLLNLFAGIAIKGFKQTPTCSEIGPTTFLRKQAFVQINIFHLRKTRDRACYFF
jgi:hypothetical protein